MKRRLYIGIVFAVITTSCTSEGKKEVDSTEVKEKVVETVQSQTPHELELNSGKKWKVDEGMTEAVVKIEKLLAEFNSNAVVDYQLLGDSIGAQTTKIIKSCTMKGKGHAELHKWLLPFLDLKKALVMTSSPAEGAALVEDIKEELTIYKNYFIH
ncbi:MAG: hypothetical protein R3279_01640 [Putridiphycobacter sp.]|nr:hypothetical protein [Putridiphycobacter sp.]